jgi:hypothetical protein
MGLDMYLKKKTYVKNWDHMTPEELHKITVKLGGKIRKDIQPKRISTIVEQVAYWRKANAIHKWFVKNVQDDEDNCKEFYVSKQQLQELVNLCKDVISKSVMMNGHIQNGQILENEKCTTILTEGKFIVNKNEIENILPTGEGFFFGSTDYDEVYLDDLKMTVEMIEPLLKENGEFYYTASW